MASVPWLRTLGIYKISDEKDKGSTIQVMGSIQILVIHFISSGMSSRDFDLN